MKELLRRLEKGELDNELSDLMKIFGCTGDRNDLKKQINKAGADKFRPLQDFIQERTIKPTDNVIKLLAIFIDFEPRPFDKWAEKRRAENEKIEEENVGYNDPTLVEIAVNTNYVEDNEDNVANLGGENASGTENTQTNTEPADSNTVVAVEADEKKKRDVTYERKDTAVNKTDAINYGTEEHEETKNSSPAEGEIYKPIGAERLVDGGLRSFYSKNKRVLRFSSAVAMIAAILFTLHVLTPEDCMCWNGEYYVEVDCQKKGLRHQIIGLDPSKLETFRKITKPDTLGIKDLGNVWYSKIDNEFEFFTGSGYHPVQFDRSLKAATKYILKTKAGRNAKETHQAVDTRMDVGLQ